MAQQFQKIETQLDDVFLLKKSLFEDLRGQFIKTFSASQFKEMELPEHFKESVYSVSRKHVLRGCHYQRHPHGHAKLVNVIEGEILDVIVGIGGKFNTRNRGKVFSVVLSQQNNLSLLIPDGYAHGFLVLSEMAIVSYLTTTVYNADHDTGVRWNSFGFDWPIENPILSEKDQNLPLFSWQL